MHVHIEHAVHGDYTIEKSVTQFVDLVETNIEVYDALGNLVASVDVTADAEEDDLPEAEEVER